MNSLQISKKVPLVCYLLGKGLPVDRPDKQGHTPLLWVRKYENININKQTFTYMNLNKHT